MVLGRGFNRVIGFIGALAPLSLAGMAAFGPGIELRAMPSAMRGQRQAPRRFVRSYRRLNRSCHWMPADSYAEARAMSPVPHIPVR